jgi:hypothetical protein
MYEVVVFITRIIIVVARLERRGGVPYLLLTASSFLYIFILHYCSSYWGKNVHLGEFRIFQKKKTWRANEG